MRVALGMQVGVSVGTGAAAQPSRALATAKTAQLIGGPKSSEQSMAGQALNSSSPSKTRTANTSSLICTPPSPSQSPTHSGCACAAKAVLASSSSNTVVRANAAISAVTRAMCGFPGAYATAPCESVAGEASSPDQDLLAKFKMNFSFLVVTAPPAN